MCATEPTVVVTRDTLFELIEDLMKLQTIIVPLFAGAALMSGCASSDPRYPGNEHPLGPAHSNENFYAVIVSIESGPATDEANATAQAITEGALASHEFGRSNGLQDAYFIRVRFDDRSYRTVTQTSLDGLRVGDSVRIENGRVRRY